MLAQYNILLMMVCRVEYSVMMSEEAGKKRCNIIPRRRTSNTTTTVTVISLQPTLVEYATMHLLA